MKKLRHNPLLMIPGPVNVRDDIMKIYLVSGKAHSCKNTASSFMKEYLEKSKQILRLFRFS